MRGRRRRKPQAYSLEYVEAFSCAESDADAGASFVAVERSLSDRLLAAQDRDVPQWGVHAPRRSVAGKSVCKEMV
jgi:hypothetical protein